MPVTPDDIIRILLSIAVGGLIGAEREYRDKAAGFRTMIFITLGSTLFTMFSIRIGTPENTVRIAANIVTGIGFLGAGVIMRGDYGVTGLTTAAAIWLSAALGLGIGGGELHLVGAATLAILVVLWLFPFIEVRIDRVRQARSYEVVIQHDNKKLAELENLFRQKGVLVIHTKRWKKGGLLTLHWFAVCKPTRLEEITDLLLNDPEVLELRY